MSCTWDKPTLTRVSLSNSSASMLPPWIFKWIFEMLPSHVSQTRSVRPGDV